MDFDYDFLEKHHLRRVDTDLGRYYYDEGDFGYKSVTSLLSENSSKQYLEDWKNRIGEEQANKISGQARTRGTAIHRMCENYLLNNTDALKKEMPVNIIEFNKIKKYLNEIETIYGIEHQLYSKKLLAAGTCDLIAKLFNKKYVVDFKTSRYTKKESDIFDYFIQASAYSHMIKEMYDIDIKRIRIIMIVDHDNPLIFDKEVFDFETVYNRLHNTKE